MEFHNIIPKRATAETATVATPSDAYAEMAKKWELIETLRGGTEAMRKAGKKYLPKEPKETNEAWEFRLNRTFLYNLYWRTVTSLVGLAFLKPVVVSNAPKELEYLEFNFNGSGNSVSEVAYSLCLDSLHYGLVHATMDFPQVDKDKLSLGEFKAAGFRPYCNHINPRNLISWRSIAKPGVPILEQLRVTENVTVPSDINEWADKDLHYVKVIRPNHADVYVFDPEFPDIGYNFLKTVPNTLKYIPITTAYSNRTGFMEAEPTLYDLAQTNLRHYQSSSDQNNILHVARVPFLHAAGFEEGELDGTEIGANRMIVSSNENSSIKHVEHTGKAIGAGRQDLVDLENQMATLGADMLISKGVGRMTATARKIDQSESMSTLQLTLRSVEQMVEQLYMIAGDWMGVDATEVSVSIGDDLSVANEPNPTNALIALIDSGLITDEQAVEEAKRQGILSSFFALDPKRPKAEEGFGEEPVAPLPPEVEDESEEDDEDEENEDE